MPCFLLKFFSQKEYLNDFLNGNLYMNTLHFFWNEDAIADATIKSQNGDHVLMNRLPDMQEDILEGVVGFSYAESEIESFNGHDLSDVILRSVGMGFCNVLCLYKLNYSSLKLPNGRIAFDFDLPSTMTAFGKYIAFILEPDTLIRRVGRAVRYKGYKYHAGAVQYHPLLKNGHLSPVYKQHHVLLETDETFDLKNRMNSISYHRDCFDKLDKYKRQNEWRIALYSGRKSTSAYVLKVGDLHDIVYWNTAVNLKSGIEYALNRKMRPIDSQYYGNIKRDEMWKQFFALGDYRAVKMLFVG